MVTKGTLILKKSDIVNLMTLADYIRAMEDAFRMAAEGKSFGVGMLHADSGTAEFHIKTWGLSLSRPYFAIKANGSCYTNMANFGLPNMMGAILLFDASNACPLAIFDSIDITRQRTGAATAVAAKYLARPGSKTVTVCGCGNQGRIQLEAIQAVLPVETVYAYSRSEASGRAFAREMGETLSVAVNYTGDLGEAAEKSNVIITCTPSTEPFLPAEAVRPGTFVAAVGADSPDKQEIDAALLPRSKVVVDIPEQCARVGELHHAIEKGLMTLDQIHGTLGQVIAGEVPGRESDTEITVYDATGTAFMDAAGAAICYEKALAAGAGTLVNLNSRGDSQ